MSFRIQPDNKIQLTKGDTSTILITVLYDDLTEYAIQENDVITMKIKETPNSVSPSLVKTAINKNVIVINPDDTSSLTSGLYCYEISLLTSHGNTYTIVPMNYFELEEEL